MSIEGEVAALFFNPPDDKPAISVNVLTFELQGVFSNGGLDRWAGIMRVINGVSLRNTEQWLAYSLDEVDNIMPEAEATLYIRGIKDFSCLPRGSRLHFPIHSVLKDEPEVGPTILSVEDQKQLGLTGVVHQAGKIVVGDKVQIELYQAKRYHPGLKAL
ncbi:hypothetical protein A3B45_01785 [Candidatus Daviesbacteria bacterium RIFCSPLOWO2_01_FULL_39_12]|uniref:MOSC domain-containing protein n=1 Tax=Candidatus Daviesbacteria bacterium RIFCSPLOWO2_01_FULL_39_12 TaxID=1797785 RepID=A0A1F5KMS0_9BACT|nr:MAG: hypothetical protein A3D79_03195 [Candidatus Daviesbacteria bacterium RIFCSPHIGHO2_02_FULL_39_8]OGE41921.1 MAG: hypothetical protein A3B45_01785 [Candidatus Daviesbacteria bacterium RIFCSPLOWO2_01_FULL_39_12]HLC97044.1 hypothetical protein [Candidatus Nanoarchaeia archaeon]